MKRARNTQYAESERRIRDLAHRLRREVERAIEPRAQALLEKSADVLGGLIVAFDDYKERRYREWDREDQAKPRPPRSARQKQPTSKRRRHTKTTS
ncbi:MAG TPA: hypothetical protein VGM73_13175 [Candidatus Didemnitutus sp.]|jgi:hypothetical protein